jgi:hypothetical protein
MLASPSAFNNIQVPKTEGYHPTAAKILLFLFFLAGYRSSPTTVRLSTARTVTRNLSHQEPGKILQRCQ